MTCSHCKTPFEDRVIPFGDRRVSVNLCQCRAEKFAAKYRNTRFDGESKTTTPSQGFSVLDGRKQRRRKTA